MYINFLLNLFYQNIEFFCAIFNEFITFERKKWIYHNKTGQLN